MAIRGNHLAGPLRRFAGQRPEAGVDIENASATCSKPCTSGTPVLLRRYAHGPGVDEVAYRAEYDAAGALTGEFYAHADRLGSIVAETDAAGVLTDVFSYDPYGNMPGAAT